MAFTTPRDWTDEELLDATIMNAHIRDNLRYLKGLDGVPTIESGLIIDNTDGDEYFLLPSLTTTERNALSAVNGMLIYNETTTALNAYENGAWGVAGVKDHGALTGLTDNDHATVYWYLAGETTDAKLYSGADLYLYSDAGSTVKAHIDGATGHIGIGATAETYQGLYYNQAYALTTNDEVYGLSSILSAYKTSATYTGIFYGQYSHIYVAGSNTQDWSNSLGVRGFYSYVHTAAMSSGSPTVTGMANFYARGAVSAGADETIVTNLYGLYIEAITLVGNSRLTNDYGIYIANQAGGATLNYAIYTNAGLVRFGDTTSLCSDVAVFYSWGAVFADDYYLFMQSDYSSYVAGLDSGYLDLGANTGIRMRVGASGVVMTMLAQTLSIFPATFFSQVVEMGSYLRLNITDVDSADEADVWYDASENVIKVCKGGASVDTLATTANISTHAALTATHGVSGAIVGTTDSQALTNKSYNGLTLTSTTGTFTLASGKTFTVSNTLTLTATDTATLAIGAGGTLGTAAYTAATAYEASGAVSTHAGLSDPHTGYCLESLIDAKGDLRVGTADNTEDRLAVGTDTHVLTADSATGTGLKWAVAAGGAVDEIVDADNDTKVQVEEAGDEDHVRIDTAGNECADFDAAGILSLAKQSRGKVYAADGTNQVLQTSKYCRFFLDTEDEDAQNEFNTIVKSGTADATEALELHDADGGFATSDIGAFIWNTTDNTYAEVTAFTDSGQITLDTDIMVNGEAYKLYHSRFTATVAGTYLVAAFAHGIVAWEDYMFIRVMKNGAEETRWKDSAAYTIYLDMPIIAYVSLSANDYLEIEIYQATGGGITIKDDIYYAWFAVMKTA